MKNNRLTEQELTQFFNQDSKNIYPNPNVGERLKYTFMVKSSAYKTSQNSFLGMFHWFFSWSNIPVKAVFISFFAFLSIINFQPTENQFISPGCDTTFNSVPLKVDSAEMLPFYADTCFLSKYLSDEKETGYSLFSISNKNFVESKTISSCFRLPPSNQGTVSICRLVPFSCQVLQALQKLRTTDLSNTSLFESPLVA